MKAEAAESGPEIGAWRTYVFNVENISEASQGLMDQIVSLAQDEGIDLEGEIEAEHETQRNGNKTYGTSVSLSDEKALITALLNWARKSGTILENEYRVLSYQILSGIK